MSTRLTNSLSTFLVSGALFLTCAADPFVAGFLAGSKSGELFQLTGGVNEFDLLYVSGAYHLFYTDFINFRVSHRQAATIAGLSSASDDVLVNSEYYPTAYFDGATWHLWTTTVTNTVKHYTAATAGGAYTYQDTWPLSNILDPTVRLGADGKYYGAYATSTYPGNTIGVLRATSAGGPWTDLGTIWPSGVPAIGSVWVGDPFPIFEGGKAYILFAPWTGNTQRIAITEVNSTTMQATSLPTVLLVPVAAWEKIAASDGTHDISGGGIFTPCYLDDGINGKRIYYSAQIGWPVGPRPNAGWGYVQS